jgi:glycosyltransferase involved in cell wall biosynthesis
VKIVHVINDLRTGGAERLVVELSREAKGQGHLVKIVALADVRGVPGILADEWGVPVTVLGRRRLDPRLPFKIWRAARGADIVHAHLFPSIHLVSLVPRIPVRVLTEHNTWNRRRAVPGLRPVEALVYSRFDLCVGISPGTTAELANYLGPRRGTRATVTIPNGVQTRLYRGQASRNPAPGKLRVVGVGRLDDQKNFERAVELVRGLDSVSLTIVGEGVNRPAIEELIARNGQAEQVTLLGARADVPALLEDHDVLLSTSRFEGFGLVVVEGMAAGLPVIAPNLPGIQDLIRNGRDGYLYDPATREAREHLELLRDDVALRKRLSENAREGSEAFDISLCSSRYLEEYSRLLAARKAEKGRRRTRLRP